MATIGKTSPYAVRLRQESTQAEQLLWRHLRNRNLGGFKFRRQATIGHYVADFLCIEARLVVEADGGQHCAAGDSARTAWLERRGFRVLRFWNNDILGNLDGTLGVILSAATKQVNEGKPSPCHLPHTGEG